MGQRFGRVFNTRYMAVAFTPRACRLGAGRRNKSFRTGIGSRHSPLSGGLQGRDAGITSRDTLVRGPAPFRCSRCFGRKSSASAVAFAAEILDHGRFGHANNSETAGCFLLLPAVLREPTLTSTKMARPLKHALVRFSRGATRLDYHKPSFCRFINIAFAPPKAPAVWSCLAPFGRFWRFANRTSAREHGSGIKRRVPPPSAAPPC
jgi:hypothetical protein